MFSCISDPFPLKPHHLRCRFQPRGLQVDQKKHLEMKTKQERFCAQTIVLCAKMLFPLPLLMLFLRGWKKRLMLFHCSARLTLIWLSGGALLPCQPVWAVVKLFERGLIRGVFVPSQDEDQRLLPRRLFLTFSVLYPSWLFDSLHLLPSFSPDASFHFLRLARAGTSTNAHMYSFPHLSLWSLIKGIVPVVWRKFRRCCFIGFSLQ